MSCFPRASKERRGGKAGSRNQRTLNKIKISEAARRTFKEKADEHSESELVSSCKSLNGRISQLSGHLIREKNRARGVQQAKGNRTGPKQRGSGASDKATAKLVKKLIGKRLTKELTEISKRKRITEADIDNSLRDALDAWSTSCVYYAITPILFGLKLRTTREIEEIKRRMSAKDPELAKYWTKIRQEHRGKGNRKLVESIRQFDRETKEYVEYTILTDIHRLDMSNMSERQLQKSLHWRALLYKHELYLDSYKTAVKETERKLLEGLEQVFVIAGITPPPISNDLRNMITNVVHDAATLARYTKSAIFSQNVEVVRIEPESRYVGTLMTSVDKRVAGKVKCTVNMGLRAKNEMGERTLLKPEVLLI